MVRDRLQDLQAIRRNSSGLNRGFFQSVQIQKFQNKKLNQILDQVQQIRTLLDLIVQNVNIIKKLQNDVLSHTNKEIQKELENRISTISQTSYCVKTKLNEMGRNLVEIDDIELCNIQDTPVHVRVQILQYRTMLTTYSNIMMDYNECLRKYHDKCSSLLHQQKILIRKNITSEELNSLLDINESSLFVDNILYETKIAKQQLADIQTRHEEVKKLEKSIVEVRDMFSELAFLVEKQGEQIDSVEYFAGKAIDNIDSGRIEIAAARVKKRKYKKRKIKMILILSLIISIFIVFAIISETVF